MTRGHAVQRASHQAARRRQRVCQRIRFLFILLQWVGSTGYTLCRRHSAWCGAFCTACPSFIYPARRYEASRGSETCRLVGENRAHGVDVGEDAAISERSPISQWTASDSGSSPTVIALELIVTFVDTIPNQSKMSGQFHNQGVQSGCTGTTISRICASIFNGL
jgi:hypothetical protein